MKRLLCLVFGHDWFPPVEAREWIPSTSTCLRCPATTITLPYGDCLGGHPIAQHYDFDGSEHPLDREFCSTRWAS